MAKKKFPDFKRMNDFNKKFEVLIKRHDMYNFKKDLNYLLRRYNASVKFEADGESDLTTKELYK